MRLIHPDGRVLVNESIVSYCFSDDIVEGYTKSLSDLKEGGEGYDRYFHYRRGDSAATVIELRSASPWAITALPDRPCAGNSFCMASFFNRSYTSVARDNRRAKEHCGLL